LPPSTERIASAIHFSSRATLAFVSRRTPSGLPVDLGIRAPPSRGDQGYSGQRAVIHARALGAWDFTNRRYRGRGWVKPLEKAKNRTKSQVRAKVEHVIGVIKRVFGFQKVCYRGLAKNLHRLEVTAALANLSMVQRKLLNA
jgi:IS5 family transposase